MIKRSDRIVYFGRTGTGKSMHALRLWIGMAPPRICIDVKDDLGDRLPGVPTIHDASKVLEYPTVRAVPLQPNDEQWYETIYAAALEQTNTVVWLDEANEVTSPAYIPAALRKYVLQGRARGCGHIACTPRPADIHKTFEAQAGHVFIFKLRHQRDRDAVARFTGLSAAELGQRLDELERHGYLYFDIEDDELVTMPPAPDPDELTERIRSLYFGPAGPRDLEDLSGLRLT